jgi:hypothetical protein
VCTTPFEGQLWRLKQLSSPQDAIEPQQLGLSREILMSQSDARLLAMLMGWIATLYGVRRGDWPGTIIALTGLVVADTALIVGQRKQRDDS